MMLSEHLPLTLDHYLLGLQHTHSKHSVPILFQTIKLSNPWLPISPLLQTLLCVHLPLQPAESLYPFSNIPLHFSIILFPPSPLKVCRPPNLLIPVSLFREDADSEDPQCHRSNQQARDLALLPSSKRDQLRHSGEIPIQALKSNQKFLVFYKEKREETNEIFLPSYFEKDKRCRKVKRMKERKWSHLVVSDSLRLHGVAYQALLSMGLSRQEYWSGLPFPDFHTSTEIKSEASNILQRKERRNEWNIPSILFWKRSKV